MEKVVLDFKGLSCPLPILRANKKAKEMIPGDTLEVLTTDPDSPSDFVAFCNTTGHQLISSRERDGVFTIEIEIKER